VANAFFYFVFLGGLGVLAVQLLILPYPRLGG
jgi:hypothetical protein